MNQFLGTLALQTLLAFLLGITWLANAIHLAEVVFGPPRIYCITGITNYQALVWQLLAIRGLPVTFVQIFAFGFLLSWLFNAQRPGYVLAIFLCPLFGLVLQNVDLSANSLEYIVGMLGPVMLCAIFIAAMFIPGFNFQRRLANRSTGTPY